MICQVLFILCLLSFQVDAVLKKFTLEVMKPCDASKVSFSNLVLNNRGADLDSDVSGNFTVKDDITSPMLIHVDANVCTDDQGLPATCKNILTMVVDDFCQQLPHSNWLKPILEDAKIVPECPLAMGEYSFSKQTVVLGERDKLALEALGNYCRMTIYTPDNHGGKSFCLYLEYSMKPVAKGRTFSFNFDVDIAPKSKKPTTKSPPLSQNAGGWF